MATAAAAMAAHMGCVWAAISGPYGCLGQRAVLTAPLLTAPSGRYVRNVLRQGPLNTSACWSGGDTQPGGMNRHKSEYPTRSSSDEVPEWEVCCDGSGLIT